MDAGLVTSPREQTGRMCIGGSSPAPVVHYDTKAGERSLDVMRWGLIPYWAKDIKIGFS
jgi:putative SOS response-associated peptidase YedK